MDRLALEPPLTSRVPISLPGLRAEVLPHRNILEVRGDETSLAQQYPGLLPGPNRSIQHDAFRAVWLRPDGWMLVDRAEDPGSSPGLSAVAAKTSARVIDVSHNLVCIALSGNALRAVLAQGTSFDLRAARFGPGQCARTWCAGFSVLLDHTATHVDLYVEATASAAYWAWLTDAALTLGNTR